jgi:hypothetical protein
MSRDLNGEGRNEEKKDWDRWVFVGTRLLKNRDSISRRSRNFYLLQRVLSALGPKQLPLQWGPRALSLRHKGDHVPTSSAEVNEWSPTSILPYACMALLLSTRWTVPSTGKEDAGGQVRGNGGRNLEGINGRLKGGGGRESEKNG